MINARLLALVVISSMLLAGHAGAFDGERRGFILGAGLGIGGTSFTQTAEFQGQSTTSDRINRTTFISDMKLGWGASKQVEIYYTSKLSWFEMRNANGKKVQVSDGIEGIGVTYSLRKIPPTWNLSGGMALSSWSLPFEDNPPKPWLGRGYHIGVGYEFSPHYSCEIGLIHGNPGKSEDGGEISANSTIIKFTINALAY
jgi:hypothetical protein